MLRGYAPRDSTCPWLRGRSARCTDSSRASRSRPEAPRSHPPALRRGQQARLSARVAAAEAYHGGSLISSVVGNPLLARGGHGGQTGGQRVQAPADSARPTQSVCAGEEERPPVWLPQVRACSPGLLRDEEAVGSNPATPTAKRQVRGLCDRVAMVLGDELRDYRILFTWCMPAVEVLSAVHDGGRLPVAVFGTEARRRTVIRSLPR